MPIVFLILGVVAIAALASSAGASAPSPAPKPVPPGVPIIPGLPTIPPGVIPTLPGGPSTPGSVPSGVPGIPNLPSGLPDNGLEGLPEPYPTVISTIVPSLTDDQLRTFADALDAAGQHKAANQIHAIVLARHGIV